MSTERRLQHAAGLPGPLYVNDFNRFGRTWQVNVQADAQFRTQVEDVKQLKVRNERGEMVPLGTLTDVRDISGPVMIMRYNMYPSAADQRQRRARRQLGRGDRASWQTAGADEDCARRWPSEWTELALSAAPDRQHGDVASSCWRVVLVFLVLAAQYESWSLPLAVILVVPMCLLCSIAGVLMARMDINIFTQIGFVVLVGLACKNAILIVEFANQLHGAASR